jgi:hypothetical protein
LIFERYCDTNPEHHHNVNEIGYMIREESFPEALEVDIGAFKESHETVGPTHLQAKAWAQAPEKRKAVPADIIGYFQCMAEMDDTAGIIRLGKCYLGGIGAQRRQGTPPETIFSASRRMSSSRAGRGSRCASVA